MLDVLEEGKEITKLISSKKVARGQRVPLAPGNSLFGKRLN